ncbi:MAG: hypothetical protein ABIF89_01635, partial [bacterium]
MNDDNQNLTPEEMSSEEQLAETPIISFSSAEKNTRIAAVAYLAFFIPLLTDAKNDPFIKFHVKQAIVLFATGLIVEIIYMVFAASPFVGWFLWLGLITLSVIGISGALKGEEKPLPLIGRFADSFK